MNTGIIRGTISKIDIYRTYTRYAVLTGQNRGESQTIYLYSYSRDLPTVNVGYRIDAEVHMEIRSYRRENGEYAYEQRCIVDTIEASKRALAYFTDNLIDEDRRGGFPQDENRIVIVGEVTKMTERNRAVATISIKTKGNNASGHYSCTVTCYNRLKDIAVLMKPGDQIALVANASSRIQRETGMIYTNLICMDIDFAKGYEVDIAERRKERKEQQAANRPDTVAAWREERKKEAVENNTSNNGSAVQDSSSKGNEVNKSKFIAPLLNLMNHSTKQKEPTEDTMTNETETIQQDASDEPIEESVAERGPSKWD